MPVSPKHIVIVKSLVFDANDYERFDVGYMLDKGMRVTLVDVADIVIPESPRNREDYANWPSIDFRIATRRAELSGIFNALTDADLVVNLVSDRHISARSLFALRAMGRMKAPSLIISSEAHPGFVKNERARLTIIDRIRGLPSRISRASFLNSLLARIPRQALGVRAADFVVHGGRRSIMVSALIGPATQAINAHSMDFNRIMRLGKSRPPQTNTAVFLDQGVIGHREYFNPAMRGNFKDKGYFQSLRALFDQIEVECGLRVVIAAHPHSTRPYDQGEFGEREILWGKSLELIAASQMVVIHNTAMTGAAVALNKPILMITPREDMYRRGAESAGYHLGLAQALNREIRFLDELDRLDIDAATRIEPDVYRRYIANYMKKASSPKLPYWQIVFDGIDRLSAVKPDNSQQIMAAGAASPQR
jgi:hypothetical protein